MLEKGREMQARELNVTRFILTARNSNAMQNLHDPTRALFAKISKRYIDVNTDPKKLAAGRKYKNPGSFKMTMN